MDGRAPTAMAELVEQTSGVAAASVPGEPAATLVPDALPAPLHTVTSPWPLKFKTAQSWRGSWTKRSDHDATNVLAKAIVRVFVVPP